MHKPKGGAIKPCIRLARMGSSLDKRQGLLVICGEFASEL